MFRSAQLGSNNISLQRATVETAVWLLVAASILLCVCHFCKDAENPKMLCQPFAGNAEEDCLQFHMIMIIK